VARYAEIARILAPSVDFIICETVASRPHARAVLEGAKVAGKPVWLSVTVDDEDGTKLRSGEAVTDVCAIVVDGAAAVLANCSAPEVMTAALKALSQCGLPYGAYANGFEKITKDFLADKPTVDALNARRDLGPETYAKYALGWIEQGATIVGGCCEVGPAHITELARALTAAGHQIV
jgi:homocysteine S-methyltransferase